MAVARAFAAGRDPCPGRGRGPRCLDWLAANGVARRWACSPGRRPPWVAILTPPGRRPGGGRLSGAALGREPLPADAGWSVRLPRLAGVAELEPVCPGGRRGPDLELW